MGDAKTTRSYFLGPTFMSPLCHFSKKVYEIDLIMKLTCLVIQILKDTKTADQKQGCHANVAMGLYTQ